MEICRVARIPDIVVAFYIAIASLWSMTVEASDGSNHPAAMSKPKAPGETMPSAAANKQNKKTAPKKDIESDKAPQKGAQPQPNGATNSSDPATTTPDGSQPSPATLPHRDVLVFGGIGFHTLDEAVESADQKFRRSARGPAFEASAQLEEPAARIDMKLFVFANRLKGTEDGPNRGGSIEIRKNSGGLEMGRKFQTDLEVSGRWMMHDRDFRGFGLVGPYRIAWNEYRLAAAKTVVGRRYQASWSPGVNQVVRVGQQSTPIQNGIPSTWTVEAELQSTERTRGRATLSFLQGKNLNTREINNWKNSFRTAASVTRLVAENTKLFAELGYQTSQYRSIDESTAQKLGGILLKLGLSRFQDNGMVWEGTLTYEGGSDAAKEQGRSWNLSRSEAQLMISCGREF